MLGILLIYFIGKAFADLAKLHDKNKWGFAILGVASYYIGTLIGGIFIGIGFLLFSSTDIETANEYLLGLMAVPFGLLACWGTHALLKRSWNKKQIVSSNEILDSDLTQ